MPESLSGDQGVGCMEFGWLQNKRVKLWLEIGLAVVLAVTMGVLGASLGNGGKAGSEDAQKIKKAEAENQAARDSGGSAEDEADAASGQADADTAEEVIADGQYPIMGSSAVTAEQMAAYYNSEGYPYPAEALAKGGADTIEAFCQMYYEEATAEGVRPEVAFAQTMKETGWLQYGGDASIEQFNFAGIGTTGGGVAGNSYPDVRTGIRAQIQHLKAYATEDALVQECVDDRYEYVLKGSAPYVEWLGQNENPQGCGWATAENYGYSIVEMINKMKAME